MKRALAVVISGLALAACGDDDSGKDDFIAEGDEICERVNAEITRINDELFESRRAPVKRQFAVAVPLLGESVKIQEDAIEDFRELEPPEEDRETIDEYVESAERQTAVLKRMVRAAEDEDNEAMRSASAQLDEISGRRQEMARDYGFKKCGGGS